MIVEALDFAQATLVAALRRAGELQLAAAGAVVVEAKGAQDIVTDVDRACESELVALLRQRHPDHAVLAEEGTGTESRGEDERPLWILDPLDGTKNYAHGSPRYGCALALRVAGQTLLAGVKLPAVDELFLARRGAGATLNGRSLAVSRTPHLAEALIGSALTVRSRFAPNHHARLALLARAVQGVRVGGCASADLCDVARGRLDAYLEEGLAPWDSAAGALIVAEAGGHVGAFDGRGHDPFGQETMACNGALLEALVSLLAAGRPQEES